MIRILWFLIFKQGVIGRDKDFRKILSFPYLLIGSGEIFVKFLVFPYLLTGNGEKILGIGNDASLSPLFVLVKR